MRSRLIESRTALPADETRDDLLCQEYGIELTRHIEYAVLLPALRSYLIRRREQGNEHLFQPQQLNANARLGEVAAFRSGLMQRPEVDPNRSFIMTAREAQGTRNALDAHRSDLPAELNALRYAMLMKLDQIDAARWRQQYAKGIGIEPSNLEGGTFVDEVMERYEKRIVLTTEFVPVVLAPETPLVVPSSNELTAA
jgi:hypothetical protein